MPRVEVFRFGPRTGKLPLEEQSLVFHKYIEPLGHVDQVDGVGLGLSISRYIVEAHGGTIWVRSEVGQGSTFGFTLPALTRNEGMSMGGLFTQVGYTGYV